MNRNERWNFWLQWVTVTLFSIAVSALIAIFTTVKVTPFPFVFIVTTQSIISITQSLVLNKRITKSARWILANLIGSCLGSSIWLWCFYWNIDFYFISTFVGLSIYAFVIVYFQWFLLRECITRQALWLRFTVAGYIVSFFASMTARHIIDRVGFYPSAGDWLILNIAYGFIQATVLIFLLEECADRHR